MFRSIILLVGGLALLCASSLFAQDAVLGQKYGLGVHAYFAGDYAKAYEQLEATIAGGSKDPRAFYFRGLTYLRLGRGPEAIQDFQKGAELESRDVNKFYSVAKALERVQGPARIEMEKYRVDARMAALEEAERMRKARYEAIKRDEARVLREQTIIPTPSPESAKGAEAAAQPSAEIDLFAPPEDKSAPGVEKKPARAATPAKKPAAGPGKKAAEPPAAPAADDPFATPPAEKTEPAKPAAEEKKPAEKKADSGDPFGI